MDAFRRPLGVLIGAAALSVIAALVLQANDGIDGVGRAALQVLSALGGWIALGALVVIVWRLVRPRRA